MSERISVTIDEYNMLNMETLQHRDTIARLTARVKELEEGLWGIINLGGTCGNAEYVRQADNIARAALSHPTPMEKT